MRTLKLMLMMNLNWIIQIVRRARLLQSMAIQNLNVSLRKNSKVIIHSWKIDFQNCFKIIFIFGLKQNSNIFKPKCPNMKAIALMQKNWKWQDWKMLFRIHPSFCIGQCKKRGYTQAGLKNGDECWCSNKQPSNNQKVHSRHCNKMCMSMTPESCGGSNHFTIFTTQCEYSYNRFIIKKGKSSPKIVHK